MLHRWEFPFCHDIADNTALRSFREHQHSTPLCVTQKQHYCSHVMAVWQRIIAVSCKGRRWNKNTKKKVGYEAEDSWVNTKFVYKNCSVYIPCKGDIMVVDIEQHKYNLKIQTSALHSQQSLHRCIFTTYFTFLSLLYSVTLTINY